MSVALEVLDEIHRLRQRVPDLSGSLVATLDGLLIAHDVSGIEPEGLAALAAAGLGLSQRTASAVRHGDVHESVLRNAGGYVATYAAGPKALLVVVAPAGIPTERMGPEARLTAERVAAIIDVLDVIDFGDLAPGTAAHADITLGTTGYRSLDLPTGPPPEAGPGGLPRRR